MMTRLNQDMSCPSSENWPQGNGTGAPGTEDWLCLKRPGRRWSDRWGPLCGCLSETAALSLHVAPPPLTLPIKALTPVCQGKGESAFGQTSTTFPLPSFWRLKKANFIFHQPGLFIGFWAAGPTDSFQWHYCHVPDFVLGVNALCVNSLNLPDNPMKDITISTSPSRKRRHREVKWVTPGHTGIESGPECGDRKSGPEAELCLSTMHAAGSLTRRPKHSHPGNSFACSVF